jgi:hypothetical protein
VGLSCRGYNLNNQYFSILPRWELGKDLNIYAAAMTGFAEEGRQDPSLVIGTAFLNCYAQKQRRQVLWTH